MTRKDLEALQAGGSQRPALVQEVVEALLSLAFGKGLDCCSFGGPKSRIRILSAGGLGALGTDSWEVLSRAFLATESSPGLLSLPQWGSGRLPGLPSPAVCVPTDPNILSLSGKVLPSCDLARRYGLRDVDGKSPGSAPAVPTPPPVPCSHLLCQPLQPSCEG